MYLTRNWSLSLDFYKFYCTTYVNDGFAAHAYRLKDFSALYFNHATGVVD